MLAALAKRLMQVRKLQGDVQRLQDHKQEMEGKASSLESELLDLRNQLKAEKEQAQLGHQTLVTQQDPITVGCSLCLCKCR